jgi:protein gp37
VSTDAPIARIFEARRLLAEARTVNEIKSLIDQAEALRIWAQRADLGLEAQNDAAAFKLDCERRAGDLLATMPKQDGGDAARARSHDATESPPRLEDLGLTRSQSSRWQAVARVPAATVAGYVAAQRRAGREITSADVRRMAPRRVEQPVVPRSVVTLTAWGAMSPHERARVIAEAPRESRAGMIEHADEDADRAIEWAIWSRNVVTGCLHDCPYCYARDIAIHRFAGYGFEPAFHPDRLHAPRNVAVPPRAREKIGHRNIFSDSMADLFGKWVPQEWIDAELAVARECPQWNFLYLTKFPQRMAQQNWPPNAWVGTSVDSQARARTAERVFRGVAAGVRWLSCEPLLERVTFSTLEGFDWIVVGGATSSSQTPAFTPPAEWVEHLIAQANAAGCQVYLKRNLDYRHEYPGQEVAR